MALECHASDAKQTFIRLIQRRIRTPPAESGACLPTFEANVYAPNQLIEYVYFPTDGIISLVNVTQNGGIVEAATVGNEGLVGIPVLLGSDEMAGQAIVQVAGDAIRMKPDVFKRSVSNGSQLHSLLLRYTLALMNLISQSVAWQLSALGRTALLPLAANVSRPSKVRLFSAYPRVLRPNAGCAASNCEGLPPLCNRRD